MSISSDMGELEVNKISLMIMESSATVSITGSPYKLGEVAKKVKCYFIESNNNYIRCISFDLNIRRLELLQNF